MTWEELEHKALKIGCKIHSSIWLELGKNFLVFKENGVVESVDINLMTTKLSANRSYDQMWKIMEALK